MFDDPVKRQGTIEAACDQTLRSSCQQTGAALGHEDDAFGKKLAGDVLA